MRFSQFFVLVSAIFAVNSFSITCAKEQVTLTLLDDAVEGAVGKVTQNSGKLRGATSATATENAFNWESAIVKFESGAKLKPLDTTSGKWKGDFEKLKAVGQFKNADEKQFVKLTEDVAQEVAKNPSKWRHIKKVLEITYGVGLAALIAVGLNAMVS
ncbi:hypothetical protein GN244_ATG08381 [Phytophthora infestans]|uniref:Secreted RxLR effector peptide protein n=1 Tax=Phytophthora infestans TaxID=4787 RepID=A0A833SVQ5_PHYIN|nr:hypothetical protein GN244_ATG08381 [Phytophthora infestans]